MNDCRYYLVSWDCEGVEHLQDVTEYHPDVAAKANLLATIQTGEVQDKSDVLAELVGNLCLRARFNPQRHYEIYLFTVADSIEFDDVRTMADETPQDFVDFVRANYAKKILDDRAKSKPKII